MTTSFRPWKRTPGDAKEESSCSKRFPLGPTSSTTARRRRPSCAPFATAIRARFGVPRRVLGTRARDRFALSDAQYVIAVEHGYTSWAEFKQACEATGLEALKGLERGEVVLGYEPPLHGGSPRRGARQEAAPPVRHRRRGQLRSRLAGKLPGLAPRGREGGRRVLTEPQPPRRRVRRHRLSAPARVALRADGRGFARRYEAVLELDDDC